MVTAPRFRKLVAHIFVRGEGHLKSEAAFWGKQSMIKEFVSHAAGTARPDGRGVGDRSWSSLRFDTVLGSDLSTTVRTRSRGPSNSRSENAPTLSSTAHGTI